MVIFDDDLPNYAELVSQKVIILSCCGAFIFFCARPPNCLAREKRLLATKTLTHNRREYKHVADRSDSSRERVYFFYM